MQPLCLLLGIDPNNFSKEELEILEVDLFLRIYHKLKEIIREKNREYFRIMKFNVEKENAMIEVKFIRSIITEIISTGEYNLTGIARYADIPEDVIYELACGYNFDPALLTSRKIVELDRTVRPDVYRGIASKIRQELLVTTESVNEKLDCCQQHENSSIA